MCVLEGAVCCYTVQHSMHALSLLQHSMHALSLLQHSITTILELSIHALSLLQHSMHALCLRVQCVCMLVVARQIWHDRGVHVLGGEVVKGAVICSVAGWSWHHRSAAVL